MGSLQVSGGKMTAKRVQYEFRIGDREFVLVT
jgi:hypothetical protein